MLTEKLACISDIVSNIFGFFFLFFFFFFLFCSICFVGSGLRVGVTPKYIFALSPEMYYSKLLYVFLFVVCFWVYFCVFCSVSVTCFVAVLPAH